MFFFPSCSSNSSSDKDFFSINNGGGGGLSSSSVIGDKLWWVGWSCDVSSNEPAENNGKVSNVPFVCLSNNVWPLFCLFFSSYSSNIILCCIFSACFFCSSRNCNYKWSLNTSCIVLFLISLSGLTNGLCCTNGYCIGNCGWLVIWLYVV